MNSGNRKAAVNDWLNNSGFGYTRVLRRAAGANLQGVVMFALLCALLLAAAQTARAQTESVLYRFCSQPNCADGNQPEANLIVDAQGNLYGTTYFGGPNSGAYCDHTHGGCGALFEVTPAGTANVIYSFGAALADGANPNGGLIQDANGNFYGTTYGGGYGKGRCKTVGCGLVFVMSPAGTETVLYSFTGGAAGSNPNGGLVFDTLGNLYGTTYKGGGKRSLGTVFKVSPGGVETVLYSFAGKTDGQYPKAGLVMDGQGNVYGTTSQGGVKGYYFTGAKCTGGCGTVFKVSAAGVETILHQFQGSTKNDGADPIASLIMDGQGNLYGTTFYGGPSGNGTVFQITPAGTETVLYSFKGPPDGAGPSGSMLLDAQGNLFGTTGGGGAHSHGAVFEITNAGSETVLYSFAGSPGGHEPKDGLTMDALGNLYGTTYGGGTGNSTCAVEGCGVVFKLTP